MGSPAVCAVIVVRDEADMLPGCLDSLSPVADDILVYDTGSADDTPALAREHGVTVVEGGWADDFAAARNRAADAVAGADWVLALDADHRADGDRDALHRLLAGAVTDALRVEVDDAHHAGSYRQRETRLYRPAVLRFDGRVHEKLLDARGSVPDRAGVPGRVLTLTHLGHATPQGRLRRAERNVALGQMMLDEYAAQGPDADRERIAGTLLALGRDCVAAERWQQGVDTFELLRDMFPGTAEWVQATDGLARLVLARGYDELCLALAEQLRGAGAAPAYCNWLAAQALAQLGDPHQAAALLTGVTEIVDTTGRRRDPASLRELTAMIDRLRALAPLG